MGELLKLLVLQVVVMTGISIEVVTFVVVTAVPGLACTLLRLSIRVSGRNLTRLFHRAVHLLGIFLR